MMASPSCLSAAGPLKVSVVWWIHLVVVHAGTSLPAVDPGPLSATIGWPPRPVFLPSRTARLPSNEPRVQT